MSTEMDLNYVVGGVSVTFDALTDVVYLMQLRVRYTMIEGIVECIKNAEFLRHVQCLRFVGDVRGWQYSLDFIGNIWRRYIRFLWPQVTVFLENL